MALRKLIIGLAWLLSGLLVFVPWGAPGAEPPAKVAWEGLPPDDTPLEARRASKPPLVDGRPDEPVWEEAAWRDDFKDMVDGSKPWLRTQTALLWDDQALYVAARMEEPRLEARIVERDGMVYRDPDFELFIAGPDAYWEIEVNASNTLYDVFWIWRDALDAEHGFPPEIWNPEQRRVMLLKGIGEHVHPRGERLGFIDENVPGLEVKVVLQGTCNDNRDVDAGWTLEMRIPWKALNNLASGRSLPPARGEVWRVNLSRFVNRDAKGNALPPLRPAGWTLRRHGVFDSHVPERWAAVVFTGNPAEGTDGQAAGHSGTARPAPPSETFMRDYLLAGLSDADRLILGKKAHAFAAGHAALTARAIREAPWANRLTSELVCRYILPHRVRSEHLENWRGPLRDMFAPLTRYAESPTKAALLLRQRLNELVLPGGSQPWSLGPLGLLNAGSGRCEELGILFVCVARAVGLPARVAYVPAWRGADGNHLWIEFWDGDWIALSPEQPQASPGTGWFLPLAAQAGHIAALAYGPAGDGLNPEKNVLGKTANGIMHIGRTPEYAHAGKLRIRAKDAGGNPVQPLVRAQVFNSGRPRSVLAGRGAEVVLPLGAGGYLISASWNGKVLLRGVRIEAERETPLDLVFDKQENESVIEIDESSGYLPLASPPETGPPSAAPLPLPPEKDGLALSDFVYADPELLEKERAHAAYVWRDFWGQNAGSPGLEPLYKQASASRIDDEPFSHWRLKLAPLVRPYVVRGKPVLTAERIAGWLNRAWPTPCDDPSGVDGEIPLSAWVDRLRELRSPSKNHDAQKTLPEIRPGPRQWVFLAVAALRTAGIPARAATLHGFSAREEWIWAEYFDGTGWHSLYPLLSPKREKRLRLLKTSRSALKFSLAEIGLRSNEQGTTWSICQISPDGVFYPLRIEEDGTVIAPSGPRFVIRGERAPRTGLARWSLAGWP